MPPKPEMRAANLLPMAIDWLRERHPTAIIVTEMSVADWGAARIDVAAITETHIVGVEIKGFGDSLTRLDRQGLAYGMVAREMWLLPCDELSGKVQPKLPYGWGVLEVDGEKVRPKNKREKLIYVEGVQTWIADDDNYKPNRASVRGHLSPVAMCGTLWKDELLVIARKASASKISAKLMVHALCKIIEESLTATVLHDQMIDALRNRIWRKPVIDLRKETE